MARSDVASYAGFCRQGSAPTNSVVTGRNLWLFGKLVIVV